MTDHECDRFLYVKNGKMVFGCINPFDCHGELGLPIHIPVPLRTDAVDTTVVHVPTERKVKFSIRILGTVGKHHSGDIVKLEAADNLEACKELFRKLFAGEI